MLNKIMIINYINKITKDDIVNFGIKEGINLSNREIDIIYDYLKNKYQDIINNPDNVLIEIKDKLSIKVYQKLLELYNKYKYLLKN